MLVRCLLQLRENLQNGSYFHPFNAGVRNLQENAFPAMSRRYRSATPVLRCAAAPRARTFAWRQSVPHRIWCPGKTNAGRRKRPVRFCTARPSTASSPFLNCFPPGSTGRSFWFGSIGQPRATALLHFLMALGGLLHIDAARGSICWTIAPVHAARSGHFFGGTGFGEGSSARGRLTVSRAACVGIACATGTCSNWR